MKSLYLDPELRLSSLYTSRRIMVDLCGSKFVKRQGWPGQFGRVPEAQDASSWAYESPDNAHLRGGILSRRDRQIGRATQRTRFKQSWSAVTVTCRKVQQTS